MTSKDVRLSLGWSQTELARRAGFPVTTIVDLENIERPRNPSFRVCMGVVLAYRAAGLNGVQPEVLFADILERRAAAGKPPRALRLPRKKKEPEPTTPEDIDRQFAAVKGIKAALKES